MSSIGPNQGRAVSVAIPRWRGEQLPASAPAVRRGPRLVEVVEDRSPVGARLATRGRSKASPGARSLHEDDAALISRILAGDEEAFQHLVEKHHAKVFRLVHGILIDWHHSEDVCQDVFTIVYRKLPGFQSRAQFSTWLYRVAVNAALKARRRWHRHERKSLDVVRDFAGTEPKSADFEGSEVFEKLLRPLP